MSDLERMVRRHPVRAAALAGAALLLVPATLLPGPGGPGEPPISGTVLVQQTGSARELLAAVRGANPIVCELATRNFGNNWGGGSGDWEDLPALARSGEETRRVLAWVDRMDSLDVAPLRDGLGDPDTCVRRASARLLGRARKAEAVDVLLEAVRSTEAGRREAAVLGLAYTDDERAVAPLVELLRDADPELRGGAAWALGHVGSTRASQPLLGVLDDREPRVRRSVARALGRLESSDAVPALANLLASDDDPTVRRAAAWALGQIE
ncbi:MAG TPA: HEAT repeat domain-containing protein [Longimicrobiaceae bacterium]|nr:HEAT repeat domain-containing protein [Longimicrobiaceae bacterium]